MLQYSGHFGVALDQRRQTQRTERDSASSAVVGSCRRGGLLWRAEQDLVIRGP